MKKYTFSKGGIHPRSMKTASRSIEILPLPQMACLPLSQHIGAPAKAVVAKGDHVSRGQVVAEHPSFVSADIHASISGTVLSVGPVIMANGKSADAIVIKADENDSAADALARQKYWQTIIPGTADRELSERLSPEEIRSAIAGSGIVGMGGAAFPSHVKLSVKEDLTPEILLINGCECEPYLMCDDALMCTWPGRVVEGVELLMKACGARKAIIGIEDNKPDAIKAMRSSLDSRHDVSVAVVRTKYPQGGEKQLIEAVTGRKVASGALPLSVGVVVHNVATAFAVWQAVATGQPLIERVVTVTGDIADSERRNYVVALGTSFSELPFTMPDEARAVAGGPMMGRTMVNLEAPIIKGTSGLTILSNAKRRQAEACVRCGACVDACPMGLAPYLISTYGRLGMWSEAFDAGVKDCLECGACSYSCPSSRPILDYIRIAKQRSQGH